MDPVADPVQPDEGQGGQGNEAPYAEYLDRLPEDIRPQVEPIFREWDSGVTRKFQEASEYRRQWETAEQLGYNQLPPEQLQWLAQFNQALSNPETIVEWAKGYAEQNGLSLTPQEQAQAFEEWQDPSTQAIEQMLEQRLNPLQQRLDAYEQQRQEQEYNQRVSEERAKIDAQVAELKAEHPNMDETALEVFAGKYAESDPANAVKRGWDDYQAFVNQIQKAAFQQKVDAPNAPESGGGVDASPPQVKFKDTTAAAIAYMRGQQQ